MFALPSRFGTWATGHRSDFTAVFARKRDLLFQAVYVTGTVSRGRLSGASLFFTGCDIKFDISHKFHEPVRRIPVLTWGYNHAR